MRFDPNLRVLYLNPVGLVASGKALEEFVGKTNEEIGMPEELCKLWNKTFDKAKKTRRVQQVEFNFSTPAGIRTFSLRIVPEYAEDGSLRSYIGISRDITERKRAEEGLRLSEQEKNNYLESMTDGFVALDKMWRYTYVNSNAARILQKTKEELIGKEAINVFPNASKFLEQFQKAVSSGDSVHFEEYYPEPLNVWYECHCYPTKDGLTVFFSDITGRKKAEEALQRSEEQARQRAEELQKLMDLIPAAIWISNDPECKVIIGNQTANRFYEAVGGENVSAGTVSGKEHNTTKRFFQNGKELSPQELPMQEAAAKNKEIENTEIEVLTPSGQKTTILGSAQPLLNAAGGVRGCLATFIDITERKKTEKALEEYSSNLEKLVEERTKELKNAERLAAIGATAGMVGHDIRNPLQSITNDVYLMKSELIALPESEEQKKILESLRETEKNVDYINKIVQDLQDYARPMNPKSEESNIKNIIAKVLQKQNMPENIQVTVDVKEEASNIKVDYYYLNRILYNLITNSIQAMPEGGKLEIQTRRDNNDILILVKDTGGGISEGARSKMFTVMFTTKARVKALAYQ